MTSDPLGLIRLSKPSCPPSHQLGLLRRVELLPGHQAAGAEEPPEVEQDPLVEGVLHLAVFQVGNAMAGHEFPGGGVAGDEVEVGAQQQRRNHGADGEEQEGEEEEQVALKPEPGKRLEVQAGPLKRRENNKKKGKLGMTVGIYVGSA